ncbi:MAG: PEP-CTERM sorting domain-containing protein [Planctomycetaceae bacterium]|jgi:hypothetical protein|nr:PEP-CTERM sorting domain-containing protein [Planctomycetaceae bacterium]
MKFYFKLKAISLTVVLMGLSGFVFADLDFSNRQALEFDSSGTMVSFAATETGDDQASGDSCTMNPTNGNNMNGSLLESEQINSTPEEPQLTSIVTSAESRLQDRSAGSSTNSDTNGTRYPMTSSNLTNTSDGGNSENPATPEPATLLILGMSLAGFVPLVKRYRRK